MFSTRLSWAVASVLFVVGAAAGADDLLWIEGESAKSHTMKPHGWYDSVVKDNLSGGQWLSHFAEGEPPVAEFRFDAATPGAHFFWVRANSVAGPRLSYQLDDGPWIEVDTSKAVGNLNIAADGKPDMRFISWINAGKLDLARGPHAMRFKFHSPNNNHGGLDCFVLSRRPFVPRGALKPGVRSGKARPGYHAWEPDADEFRADALVDLAYLNEDVAGQHGYIKAEGNDFTLATGEKVRFWGVNCGPGAWELDHASHVHLAKSLAKRGVNLVRLHGALFGQRDPAVNRKRLDDLHHLAFALKQEGIYVALSFYFPLWFHLDGDQPSFSLLFFDRQMQEHYFNWADALLNTPNPYAGMPLGKDPCVAMVEVVNEDSHFFWTFGKKNVPQPRWQELTRLYGDWLKAKHGSLDGAIAAWGGVREPGDEPERGRVDLYDAWMMTTDGLAANGPKRKRIADQIEFLSGNMRDFHRRAIDHFRARCGYAGLVCCGNWHTADPRTLDALERHGYTAGDVIDHHGYFDHGHQGEAASWSVRPGQTFESRSALHLRDANPLPYVETDGYPHIVSEIGWPRPNAYRAEGVFLTAAYGSLQGLDGIMHFAIDGAGWSETVGKFSLNDPVALGSYPAAALAYRRAYIQEAPAVVVENLRLEDLYAGKGSKAYVGAAMDALRVVQVPEGDAKPGDQRRGPIAGVDPLTFYVGRVARRFGQKPEESMQQDVRRLADREAKTITSVTGQLAWDYGAGCATANAPKFQGAAGFLGKRGPVQLADVCIEMANEYGAVMVVALDDRPLVQSKRLLIQCTTIDELYGWTTSDAGGKRGTIQSLGSAPWNVEDIKTVVRLKWAGPPPARVVACDENGYATDRPVDARTTSGGLAVTIDPSTACTVIER
ncbi:MAG: hypothetical protein JW809_10115 [Pirellulales bacterium]|nr:hypothetical protein [Pirellulales bacterium]